MSRRIAAASLVAASFAGTMAWAGHELPIYPSFYPHEIDIATVTPERAVALIEQGQIQAYIGAAPPPTTLPDSVGAVELLGSFIVVAVNPGSPRDACAVTAAVIDELAGHGGDFVFHPYPVTPFHGDYLYHADLATAAKRHWVESGVEGPKGLKVKPIGVLVPSLVRGDWQTQAPDWDAKVAEVDVNTMIGRAMTTVNGWLGPPWLRKGWFHANLLLGDTPTDLEAKPRTAADVERLTTGDYEDAAERINLERDLVGLLSGGCHKTVAGYTVRRNYFNNDYSAGIENIAYDSVGGFATPMFLRTAKLKDFPWNGWLGLGTDARPAAAWNPVAGFTDDFGRLMWFALGDPAVLPAPNDSGWTINRIADVAATPAR
jgi:hypothetical protein